MEKKSGLSKRRGAGKILLATTLAGTAATSAMTQSATTGAINLKGLFEKAKTFITQKSTEHPKLGFLIGAVVGVFATLYSIYRVGEYLLNQEGNDISDKELVSSQANIDNSKTLTSLVEESKYNALKNVSISLNVEQNSTGKEIFNDEDLKKSDSLRNRSYQINRDLNKIGLSSTLANGQYNNFFDSKDKRQDVSNSLIGKELVKNRYEDNVRDDNSNINEDLDVNEGEKLDKDGFKISDLRNYRSYEINNEVNRIKNSNSADDEDDDLVNYDDKNLSKGKSHEYGGFTFYDDDKSNESNPIKNANEGFGWE